MSCGLAEQIGESCAGFYDRHRRAFLMAEMCIATVLVCARISLVRGTGLPLVTAETQRYFERLDRRYEEACDGGDDDGDGDPRDGTKED